MGRIVNIMHHSQEELEKGRSSGPEDVAEAVAAARLAPTAAYPAAAPASPECQNAAELACQPS